MSTMYCVEHQYLIRKDLGDGRIRFSCMDCTPCPHGLEPKFPCFNHRVYGDYIDIECVLCKEDSYSDEYDFSPCKDCTVYGDENVSVECGRERNRLCGSGCTDESMKFDAILDACVPKEHLGTKKN